MKHAYLIIAHNQFQLLKQLLRMLDYTNNDIYLHIDNKVPNEVVNSLNLSTDNASLSIIRKHAVSWGDYSQIQVEMALLNEATKQYHDYYHLLSGVDLPIKSHSEIEKFFEVNKGLEFVSFDKPACENRSFEYRCMYYHKLFRHDLLNSISLRIQKLLKVNRIRKANFAFMKGSNWFDITHDFAVYVCEKMSDRKFVRYFYHSSCADEVFLQTLLFNSEYYCKKADKGIRFIDWSKHGRSPEILTMDYWTQIQQSDKIFARKFSMDVDASIISTIEATYGQNVSK